VSFTAQYRCTTNWADLYRWFGDRVRDAPNQSALLGQEFFCQGLLASNRVGLTRGLAIRIGN
jgi:hypothetical protein